MPRVTLNRQVPLGPYPTLPVSAGTMTLTETAADTTNKEQFTPSGDDLIIAHNTGASARTITITSVVDEKKRTGDVSAYSIAAGGIALFRITKPGWMQTDGKIYIEANNAEVKWAVVQLG